MSLWEVIISISVSLKRQTGYVLGVCVYAKQAELISCKIKLLQHLIGYIRNIASLWFLVGNQWFGRKH